MTVTDILPNDELVAIGWLRSCGVGLVAAQIATRLPNPPWIDDLFVQIMQVGGDADLDNPMSSPVVSVNVFATKTDAAGNVTSTKPPWHKAAAMAQAIWLASYDKPVRPDPRVVIPLPDNYQQALVLSVAAVSRPNRITLDPSQYAVFNVDLQITWIPSEVVIV